MSAKRSFSIVTVVLNDRPGFIRTRASIETQDQRHLEWLVVDGGSNDGTEQEIRHTAVEAYTRISEPDKGLYDAMNKGLDRASGEYVIFMNAGDQFASGDVIGRMANLLATAGEQYDFLFGDAYEETVQSSRLLKRARSVRSVRYGMFTHHQSMFYRRDKIGSLRYDCSLQVAGDYAFTSKFLKTVGSTLYTNFPICTFERGGVSMRKAEVGRREALGVQRNILGVNLPRRVLNHMAFLTSQLLQRHFRGFYDRVRFRPAL